MLTTCLLLLSTTTWAQDSGDEAPADDAPETQAPAEEGPGANPPPWEAGGQPPPALAPEAEQPPPPVRPPQQARHAMQRQMKMKRCESWEIAVWNPRKTGCAAQPDATGDDWCPVPAGMTPIEPVGDTNKWWVKRCADQPAEGPPPGG